MTESQRSELEAAIAAATTSPDDDRTWDRVEALAEELDAPDAVAAAYRDVLRADISRELALPLGERAARFHEEWFGEDPAKQAEVLTRVLEFDPKSEWAFQRLTVVYTISEKWDELFALYDRSLEAADKKRRAKLLEEAYQSARDLANEPDRAIVYLQRLLELKPSKKRAQQLERLLERHERWRDLIRLWERRLGELKPDEQLASRLRIAALWLDRLDDPAQALDATRPILLDLGDDDAETCALLERILTSESAPVEVREGALDLLRERYGSTGRPREVIRVLEQAIPLFPREKQKELLREIGSRVGELGEHGAAAVHFSTLLKMDPGSTAAQRSLREAAEISQNFERYADALAEAAEHAEDAARKVALLSDAARTRLDLLEDESGAIDLFQSALSVEGIPATDVLTIGRRLNELLHRAERSRERLDVIERLAAAESLSSSRRALVGDGARLAEELGETDHALAAWRSRLDADPDDLAALDAMVALLEKEERWDSLIEALQKRVRAPLGRAQRRADLIRVARIYEELGEIEKAIEAWGAVRGEFGTDAETVEAFADLLGRAERWGEAADLLEQESRQQTERLGERLVKLGDSYARDPETRRRALDCYRRALAVDPRQEGARAGLAGLLEDEDLRGEAAESLSRACRENGDWTRFLELVEPRLDEARSGEARLEILREAATIQEQQIGDRAAALAFLTRAFPLAPRDRSLEDHMLELARQAGEWSSVLEAYRGAIDAVEDDPVQAAKLHAREGEILEKEQGDLEAAHRAYFAVIGAEPDNLPVVAAVVRIGSRLGRWAEVSAAICTNASARGRAESHLLDDMEEATREGGAWDEMAGAFGAAIRDAELPPRVSAELFWRLARWHRDERQAPEAAEEALREAVSRDPDRQDTLRALAELQRARGAGPDLFETLRRLCDHDPHDLDLFRETAEVGVEHADRELARASLNALFGKASAAWRGSGQATGESDPQTWTAWAVERLVDDYQESKEPRAALDLLMDAARLPFDAETRQRLRIRAASIADEVGDTAGAIEVYRAVLSATPDNADAAENLASLYEREDRLPELLALRRHELSLAPPAERRLELRLKIARILGDIERRGGRLQVLRANLEENPGHEPSIEALVSVLDAHAQHEELLDLLTEQARKLEELGEAERAAKLWSQSANIAEKQVEDTDRALYAYGRVVALSPTPEALDAVARLYTERGQAAEAVPWLEQRLAGAAEEERPRIVLELARALLEAGQRDRAIASLERAIAGGAATFQVRSMLADLYRQGERWEPLAQLLTEGLSSVQDSETAVAWAREAAAIYHQRLHAPANAIPALEKALSFAPDDRELRTMMAVGLRVAGSYEEARTILESLIAEFGRRRSKERAAIHVELGSVARAEGNLKEAVDELELASRMDSGNARIMKQLAQLGREGGNLDQAERSLRALLLLVRREPPGDDEEAVGVSEVLWDLSAIAEEREDEEKANELLESALEAAAQSDAEVHRLRRTLLGHGKPEILLRALRQRLEAAEEADSKAQLLTDIAELLEGPLDRPAEALDARMEALELFPGHMDRQRDTRALAARLGEVERYLDRVEGVVSHLRREEEAPMAAEILMDLGRVAEEDLKDRERARRFYARAEETGQEKVDSLFALARVCGDLGDTEEQTRALDELTEIAKADQRPSARADALYRLAEMQVSSAELAERGVELCRQALEIEPRYAQAGAILRAAAELRPDDAELIALYEPVARHSGDREVLLDFLERRSQLPQAEPDQVKEAVDLAVELEQPERGEALLARAVEAARLSPDGIAAAVWAVLGLAERKVEAGDLEGARELLLEGADVAPPERVQELGLTVAERAAGSEETLGLAADIYGFLRARNPGARAIWEPLFEVYRRMDDPDRLHELVAATLPALVDVEDRNRLRIQNASFLIDSGRGSEATEILRDALLDDPDAKEASALLEKVLVEGGDEEGLADFLWQRFEEARERRNPDTVSDVACRLGALLDRIGSGEALSVYRAALEIAPESRELLEAVLQHVPEEERGERAELLERLLAVEGEERAPDLALQLAELRDSLGDAQGAQRALEAGHRASPFHEEIRPRLERFYRDNALFTPLAEMVTREAEALDAPEEAVARFRDAARIYREDLSDLRAAADVLEKARGVAPDNDELVAELASCLTAAGDVQAAVLAIGEALGRELGDRPRVDLLLLRSDLRMELGQDAQALEDLEETYALDAERTTPLLVRALERRRSSAAEDGDREAERAVTLRLTELLLGGGEEESARGLLLGWIERAPEDREALYKVRDMDAAASRWDGVVAATSRLVRIEQGEDQIDAASRLARAAEELGDPGQALAGLEEAHRAQPESETVRDLLRRIYESSGAHRELADLLVADADHADDDEARYEALRKAADLYVNYLQDPEAAIGPAERARELKPDDHETVVLLADVLTTSGKLQEAEEILDPAIKAHKRRSPELASLQHRMARIHGAGGDHDGHLSWLKKAFDVDRKDPYIAAELAHLATELGEYDLALKPLRAITLMDTPGPVSRVMALLWEAKIEHARGNQAKAEMWAKKALREDPNYEEAEEFLQEISQ